MSQTKPVNDQLRNLRKQVKALRDFDSTRVELLEADKDTLEQEIKILKDQILTLNGQIEVLFKVPDMCAKFGGRLQQYSQQKINS